MEFKKSQIIYMKTNSYEANYIKIIYYIEKINNETYNKLFYKEDYFNYILDFLYETKEDSLYSLLNKISNNSIKSLVPSFEIIFKSKINFRKH